MYLSAYETTLLKRIKTKPIEHELEKQRAMGELQPAFTIKGRKIEGVFTVPSTLKSLPVFSHPLFIDRNDLVIDTRAYLKLQRDGEYKVTVPNEYMMLLVRAIMTKAWRSGEKSSLLAIDFIVQVFSRWVSEGLTRRLALSPLEHVEIMVVSAYHYLSLFEVDVEEEKLASKISTLFKVPMQKVLSLIDIPASPDVDSLINLIKSKIESPRVQTLNHTLLYASVCTMWYGSSSRELLSSALEFPPDFIAVCYTGLTDRSYRKAPLTKTIEQVDHRGSGATCLEQIKRLIMELSDE